MITNDDDGLALFNPMLMIIICLSESLYLCVCVCMLKIFSGSLRHIRPTVKLAKMMKLELIQTNKTERKKENIINPHTDIIN